MLKHIGNLVVVAVVVMLIAWWVPPRLAENVCGDQLQYVGLAIANYHDTYGKYPSPNAGGHSWRIRIVPFQFASQTM